MAARKVGPIGLRLRAIATSGHLGLGTPIEGMRGSDATAPMKVVSPVSQSRSALVR